MSNDDFENIPRSSCLYCDSPFDEAEYRVFCDNDCKSSYNQMQRTKFLEKINTILKRNWDVLKEHLGTNSEMEIDKWELMLKDFNFCYHTHSRTEKNKTIFYCYDYSFTLTDNTCLVSLE